MKSFGIPELIHEYAVAHSDGDGITMIRPRTGRAARV